MKKQISILALIITYLCLNGTLLQAQIKRELTIVADSSLKIDKAYWKEFANKIEKMNDSINADIEETDETEFGMTKKVVVDSQSLLVNIKIYKDRTTLRIRKSEKPTTNRIVIRKIEFNTDQTFEDDSEVKVYLPDGQVIQPPKDVPANEIPAEKTEIDFQDKMEELKSDMEKLNREMEQLNKEESKTSAQNADCDNCEDNDEIFGHPNPPKRRKPRFIITDTRFSLGFLQMQPNEPTTTVIHYNTIPELNNGKSLTWGFQHNWGINLIRGKLRLWNGLSYDVQNYRFANNQVRLTPNNNEFKYFLEDPSTSGSGATTMSKLVSHYIGMPIALGFQNKSRNPSFQVRVGVQGGYLINSFTKVEFENDNKIKHYDDFNLNHFSLQPFTFIQYENIAIYARYSIMDVFKKNEGLSNARTMSFGISIGV
jgi:hypothetical protein